MYDTENNAEACLVFVAEGGAGLWSAYLRIRALKSAPVIGRLY